MLPLLRALARGRRAPLDLLEFRRPEMNAITPDRRADVNGWLEELVVRLRREGLEAAAATRVGHNYAGVLREAIDERRPQLLVLPWSPSRERALMSDELALRDLLLDILCDVAIVVPRAGLEKPARVLFAAPPDRLDPDILHFAWQVAEGAEGEVTLLAIHDTKEQRGDPAPALREQIQRLREPSRVKVRIASAASPQQGILQEASVDDYDLLVVGSPSGGVIHRLALGNLPERVARRAELPVVIYKPVGSHSELRRRWTAITRRLPTLSESEKVEVYREIRRSARPGVDFFTMMALATTIATLGMMMNSGFVVIGAMLVAPLMSPVIAIGLAVTQGDSRLLRLAVSGVARGSLTAMLVALVLAVAIPGEHLTSEVLARTEPSLFDLGVALASGIAGAYALGRPQVAASLPGVAIAVALVPPLAVVSVGLANLDRGIAGGAILLFLANLAAISAAGGMTFLLLGFRPEPEQAVRVRLFSRGFTTLALLVLTVSIPIAWLTLSAYSSGELRQDVAAAIDRELAASEGARRLGLDIRRDQDPLTVTLDVEATRAFAPSEVQTLEDGVAAAVGHPVRLIVRVLQVSEIRADDELPPAESTTEAGPSAR